MKKIISIILILVMCTGLVSCSKAPEEPEIVEVKEVKYKGYFDIYLGDRSPLQGVFAEKGYTKATDLNFGDRQIIESNRADAPKERTFEYMGEEYTLKYCGSVISDYAFCDDKRIRDEKFIDAYIYRDPDNLNFSVLAEFNRKTEKVEFFYSSGVELPTVGGFTPEDAEEKAAEYIKSLYGEKALEGYEVAYSMYWYSSYDYCYEIQVNYSRVFVGIDSDDYITMSFDLEGNITSFSAAHYGYIDALSNEITEERIENAFNKLQADFGEVYDYELPSERRKLLLDTRSGKVYLKAKLVQKNAPEWETWPLDVYINLY